jgi:formamidopyrimidine-DNA glycosylase
MPELPDLQVFSRNLEKQLKGQKVKKVAVPVGKKLNVSVSKLKKALEGAAIKKIRREGKELHFFFSNGNVLGLHLMLHGNLDVFEGKNKPKHTILELLFENGKGLALSDWQRAAVPTLNPVPRDAPDALSKKITGSYLKQMVTNKKTSIKNVLLDQQLIRGIGNAYADEILWDARISPFSIAGKIPAPKLNGLSKSIRKILTNAETKIRKKHPDITSGEVRDFLVIHNSKKKQSPRGAPILHSIKGGRKTYYTKEQENFN